MAPSTHIEFQEQVPPSWRLYSIALITLKSLGSSWRGNPRLILGRAGSRTCPQPRGSCEGQQVHPNTSPAPDRAREEPGPDGTTSVTSFLVGSDPVCATPRRPTFGSCRNKSTWICPCCDSRCLPEPGRLRVRPRRRLGCQEPLGGQLRQLGSNQTGSR